MHRLVSAFVFLALTSAATADPATPPFKTALFLENAGRVAWHHGSTHDLIAYDAVVSSTYAMDVFTIKPDGSAKTCITCKSALPQGFRGQMEWHPSGEFLVLQAENANSRHQYYNHPAWGVDNDLWLIRKDGSDAQKIWSPTQRGGGALHARFSRDGKKLVFAERMPTGKQLPPIIRRFGPGGESQWDGWRIHIADIDPSKRGTGILSNHRQIMPNGTGFYETSGFTPDGKLIYAHTGDGQPYCDDIFVVGLDGGRLYNFSRSPSTWEEHGQFSPDGNHFAFLSSRADKSLSFPRSKARDLTTELFLQRGQNPPIQLTRANDGTVKKVVSRYAWSPDSKRILYQLAELDGRKQPELWMLELP